MAPRKEWKPIKLDAEDCLNLSEILVSFSAPITEQHAWAIIFQSMKSLLCTLEGNFDWKYVVNKFQDILVTKNGDIHSNTFTKHSADRSQMKSTASSVAELGVVVYDALDYNLPEEEERQLSQELENLLDTMTSADDDSSDSENNDEGIDNQADRMETDLIEQVLRQCRHHLAVEGEADDHYRGVCRALVTEALELCSFMARVSSNSQANMDFEDELQSLAMHDWAHMWTSVMHQLRTGVRLKKVEYSRTPSEFAMTPYEMLMGDIKARRYKLNHVEISARVRKDAREVILDFIRSRPPLRSANDRQLKPLRKESTPGELLMQDIRSSKARQSLRRTNHPKPVRPNFDESSKNRAKESAAANSESKDAVDATKVDKKVILLDESLLKDMLDFEDDETNTSMEDVSPDSSPHSSNGVSPSNGRKSANPVLERKSSNPDLKKSSTKRLQSSITRRSNVSRVISDTKLSASASKKRTSRKSLVLVEDTVQKDKTDNSTPILSPLTRQAEDHFNITSPPLHGFKDWEFVKKLHSLDLSLEELAHIRSQLTKAELEDKPVSKDILRDLEKGRLCFACEKIRFGMFHWASVCAICNKYICSKCSTKIKLPSDQLKDIPVSILTNQLLDVQRNDSDAESSLIRRFSTQLGISNPTPSQIRAGTASPASSTTSPPGASATRTTRAPLYRQQTSPNLKETPVARPAFQRNSGWNRASLRLTSDKGGKSNITSASTPSRPKLVRAKTMGKSDVERISSMKLSQPGTIHTVCTSCREILTCIVRAKQESDKLSKIKSRLASFREEF